MLSRFHLIPERYGQTDRRADGQTELLYRYTPASVAQLIASRYAMPGYTVIGESGFEAQPPRLAESLCQVIAAYALRLNSRAGTEGSTVSSLICDRWLILGSE